MPSRSCAFSRLTCCSTILSRSGIVPLELGGTIISLLGSQLADGESEEAGGSIIASARTSNVPRVETVAPSCHVFELVERAVDAVPCEKKVSEFAKMLFSPRSDGGTLSWEPR